ncbi:MAG TPA: DUF1610 domain-containing protein [Euryarchaeota archaeon]|nr:MAG: RNA-binding protein [Thermococci archaeon]RLF94775.1 MAG: RNA-binding protein [Thermococci archaeon]HDI10377.1 DUF1610 domain-containing protein [Euryarchaeota archaeon]
MQETPRCISCQRDIKPRERSVKFFCPSCGEVLLWRCEVCRIHGNKYTCPECGFEGP